MTRGEIIKVYFADRNASFVPQGEFFLNIQSDDISGRNVYDPASIGGKEILRLVLGDYQCSAICYFGLGDVDIELVGNELSVSYKENSISGGRNSQQYTFRINVIDGKKQFLISIAQGIGISLLIVALEFVLELLKRRVGRPLVV